MTRACQGILGLRPGEEPCKFWAADMDMDPFCVHPVAIKVTSFGLNTTAMQREGLCAGPDYPLWETDTDCRKCRGHTLWVDKCETCGGTGQYIKPVDVQEELS